MIPALTGTIHHPTAREKGRESKGRKKKGVGANREAKNTFKKENDNQNEREEKRNKK